MQTRRISRKQLVEAFKRGYRAAKKRLNEVWDANNKAEDVVADLETFLEDEVADYDLDYLLDTFPKILKTSNKFHNLVTTAMGWMNNYIEKNNVFSQHSIYEVDIRPELVKIIEPVVTKHISKWGLKGEELEDAHDYITYSIVDEIGDSLAKQHHIMALNDIKAKHKAAGYDVSKY